jgi:hypothetical protein
MEGSQTAIYKIADHWNDEYVSGTPEYRIGFVWPLTREIASLKGIASFRSFFTQSYQGRPPKRWDNIPDGSRSQTN